jgi:hypothetical protein
MGCIEINETMRQIKVCYFTVAENNRPDRAAIAESALYTLSPLSMSRNAQLILLAPFGVMIDTIENDGLHCDRLAQCLPSPDAGEYLLVVITRGVLTSASQNRGVGDGRPIWP